MPQQRSTDHFELKPAQQRVLGVLKSEGTSRLTRARYEELSGVGRSQAAYDLAELVEKGILERLGSGRASRYRLVHLSTPSGPGRPPTLDAGAHPHGLGGDSGRPLTRGLPRPSSSRRAISISTSRQPLRRDPVLDVGARSHARAATGAPPARPPRRTFRPRLQCGPAAAVAVLALALAGAGHVRLSRGGAVVEAAPPQLLDGD